MTLETYMSDASRRAFVMQSELADGSKAVIDHHPHIAVMSEMGDVLPDPQGAAVVGSNLLAFAEGVSRQNKEDVMDSFLFATLVANKAFNPETQSQQWYARFNGVLSTLGWLSTNWSYSRYRASHQLFTMDQAGLEILASAIAAAALPGPASAAMLSVAADALKTLQASEKPLRLFERQTKSHQGANFRIGACVEAADGTINLAIGAVNFQARSEVVDVLFWEWDSANVETFRGEDHLVLNRRLYAQVRETVQRRLGDNAKSAIEEFEI